MKFGELTGPEQDMMAKLHQLVDQVTSLVLAGKRNEAIGVLLLFEEEFLRDYDAGLGQKVRAQDPAALFVLYNVGITCVKLASSIISTSAEDVYQTEFRKLEEEPSIYIVMWPEAVMARVQDSVRQTSDESVAKA
jgi:isoleucyl-tRNA synthetase